MFRGVRHKKGFLMRDFEIKFKGIPDDTHICTSFVEGDWVVFRCPICQGYERRINLVTDEIRVIRNGSTANHIGYNCDGKPNLSALTACISKN